MATEPLPLFFWGSPKDRKKRLEKNGETAFHLFPKVRLLPLFADMWQGVGWEKEKVLPYPIVLPYPLDPMGKDQSVCPRGG